MGVRGSSAVLIIDAFVKSPLCLFSVIPAKAGIQPFQHITGFRLSVYPVVV